jgi:hypothetical protein
MLLTISIVHIMPEATEMYAEYLKDHAKEEAGHDDHRLRILEEDDHDDHDEEKEEHAGGFPLPYAIFLAGFMLMLILD